MDLRLVADHTPAEVTDEERDAAVLVPVIERAEDDYLLFTERAAHLGRHPGQMSFPGGGREPEDADLAGTAIREAGEEVGMRPEEVELVGRLDDIRTVSRYAVTPFVARVVDREYVPDEREVAEIAVLPVAALTDPENYEVELRDHPALGEVVVHYFHVNGYTVWGATARILAQLLELAAGWRPPSDPDGRPGDGASGGVNGSERTDVNEDDRAVGVGAESEDA